MGGKRRLAYLPWVLCLASAGFGGWQLRTRHVLAGRVDSLSARVHIMDDSLFEARIATIQLERKRELAERTLQDLFASKEDARRAYELQKVASEEATARSIDAMRQAKAKEAALQGEQTARAEEQVQRKLAEERLDSISAQKRVTDQANLRLRASKVAQNSMAVKGEKGLRGLMAVHAFHAMEQARGDVNKQEIVGALQGALEEAERASPVGVDQLSAAPRTMVMMGSELRLLGNDGRVIAVDPAGWQKHAVTDASRHTGSSGGLAVMGDGVLLLANAERAIVLCSAVDGAVIAQEDRTPHTDDISSMAAFPGGGGMVSGDIDGRAVVWATEGGRLRIVREHNVGGVVRGMIADAKSGTVVAVNGTERILIFKKDGTMTTVSLSDADRAHCIANGAPGEVLIGSHQGAIFTLQPGAGDPRRIHNGGGQRVERIAADRGEGRLIAYADAVRGLTVIDRKENTRSIYHLLLPGIPSAMTFGNADVVYLGYSDHTVRRMYTNSASMADRICALAGRPWTNEEWQQHIGEGDPEPTCAAR